MIVRENFGEIGFWGKEVTLAKEKLHCQVLTFCCNLEVQGESIHLWVYLARRIERDPYPLLFLLPLMRFWTLRWLCKRLYIILLWYILCVLIVEFCMNIYVNFWVVVVYVNVLLRWWTWWWFGDKSMLICHMYVLMMCWVIYEWYMITYGNFEWVRIKIRVLEWI